MAFPVDPTTPAGVQPNIPGAAGYTVIYSDEFNSTTLDETKWRIHKNFADYSRPSNWDVNSGGNSCLRIWPDSSQNYPDMNIDTANSFSSFFGVYETSFKSCVGKGIFPGVLWMVDAALSQPLKPEIDVMEIYGIDGGGWTNGASDGWKPRNGAFTVWYNGGGNQTGSTSIKLTDADACWTPYAFGSFDLSAQFLTLTIRVGPEGLTTYIKIGAGATNQWGCTVPLKWTQAEMDGNPLMTVMDLAWRDGGVPDPNPTDTPSGSSNSCQWDYVRIWALPGAGGGSTASTTFQCAVTMAPPAGATIQNMQHLEVAGNLIGNAELLSSATASTTLYGRFTVAANGQSATLDWDTHGVPNSTRDYRILGYNVPPGTVGSVTTAMASTSWIVNNVSSSAMPVLTDFDWMF